VPRRPIPVIDLFAGPGGLSEGFASLRTPSREPCFDVRLSIEKDQAAHQTLELRSFVRAFRAGPPDAYYDFLAGDIDKLTLMSGRRFKDETDRAAREAWHYTLSEDTHRAVSHRVRHEVGQTDEWLLIGGPPCQAYSVVGRARMRSVNPRGFARDERHFLYREYLRILADHAPAIFVMENVRGILSSTVRGRLIFMQILEDLARPGGRSLRYRVVPLCVPENQHGATPEDYVIRCEQHGVPQTRHRVILCGIREDLSGQPRFLSQASEQPAIEDAIADLPPIRSRISRGQDSPRAWISALKDACQSMRRRASRSYDDVISTMEASVTRARTLVGSGGSFVGYGAVRGRPTDARLRLRRWYLDPKLDGVTGHESRFHMESDLHRYLFAASYALARRNATPKLRDFPRFLLPRHRSAHAPAEDRAFADRFRVQVFGRPATTVVSHIAKDGHYYIHPDPAQCRSLTLREAARIQTFPDNYHFLGTRTEALSQVGNAVPPLLAQQIARTIWRHCIAGSDR
jgi:DNA (cytosine-5)-methyltransferase 1